MSAHLAPTLGDKFDIRLVSTTDGLTLRRSIARPRRPGNDARFWTLAERHAGCAASRLARISNCPPKEASLHNSPRTPGSCGGTPTLTEL